MGKESLEPGKQHHVSLSGTMPAPSGTLSTRVSYGWDQYSLLILSIILTGTFPLAITSGIAVGAIIWSDLAWWWAVFVGFGAAVGMMLLEGLLLYLLTRPRARQRLIPWARRLFPSSGEVTSKDAAN